MFRPQLILGLLPLLAGCGGPLRGDAPMSGHLSTLDHQMEGFSAELQAHRSSIDAAQGTAELGALEAAHMEKAEADLARMMETSEAMHACLSEGGASPDVERLHALAGQLRQECHNHRAAMAGVADLAAAREEEERHHALVGELQTQLMAEMIGLGPTADEYSCHGAHPPHGGH